MTCLGSGPFSQHRCSACPILQGGPSAAATGLCLPVFWGKSTYWLHCTGQTGTGPCTNQPPCFWDPRIAISKQTHKSMAFHPFSCVFVSEWHSLVATTMPQALAFAFTFALFQPGSASLPARASRRRGSKHEHCRPTLFLVHQHCGGCYVPAHSRCPQLRTPPCRQAPLPAGARAASCCSRVHVAVL